MCSVILFFNNVLSRCRSGLVVNNNANDRLDRLDSKMTYTGNTLMKYSPNFPSITYDQTYHQQFLIVLKSIFKYSKRVVLSCQGWNFWICFKTKIYRAASLLMNA